MKSKLLLATLALLVATIPATAFAAEPELTEAQSAKISSNCSTIRQNLKNLQRTDSHARTYFGAIYETVFTKYLKPMNLRLVHNDLSSSSLLEAQTTIASTRSRFSEDFISYSKSLEELIVIDCHLEPGTFYKKLQETREKRAKVAADIKTLNQLLTSSVKSVEALKGTLND